jgi:hypothetical protein
MMTPGKGFRFSGRLQLVSNAEMRHQMPLTQKEGGARPDFNIYLKFRGRKSNF